MHHVSCRDFGKTNHPDDLALLQPRFGAQQLLAFSNTKITFEREEISDHQWDSEKYNGTADSTWESYVRSQGAHFEGDWGIIVLCTMFPVSCIFFNKCLYFSYCLAGWFLDRSHTYKLMTTRYNVNTNIKPWKDYRAYVRLLILLPSLYPPHSLPSSLPPMRDKLCYLAALRVGLPCDTFWPMPY